MKVFAYYHNPKETCWPYPDKLIACWHDSWKRNGFEPHLLTESDARQHERFEEAYELADRLPTVNHRIYERACWLRWLAYIRAAPGVFSDYDVINYGLKSEQIPTGDLVCLSTSGNPGCVYATAAGAKEFTDYWMSHATELVREFNGQPHISDLYVFERWFAGPKLDLCRGTDHTDGADNSPLVHLHNGSLPPELKHNNRYLAAEMIAKQRENRPNNYQPTFKT